MFPKIGYHKIKLMASFLIKANPKDGSKSTRRFILPA